MAPSSHNEPHRDDDRHDEREFREGFGGHPNVPTAETLLLERFTEFCAEHSLTALGPKAIEHSWRTLEPRFHQAVLADLAEQASRIPTLRALAGAVSSSGSAVFLVLSQDPETGDYVIPTSVVDPSNENEESQPRATLTSFFSHGVGLLVSVPELTTTTKPLSIGLDYLLTPSAMQLDQDRFLTRSPSSVIGSCFISSVYERSHRSPQIESISRRDGAYPGSTTYRVSERDGTRHFMTIAPGYSSSPNGVVAIETVPAQRPIISLPRTDRHGGRVGLHFEEFHRRRGFNAVDPDDLAHEFPTLQEGIFDYLKNSLPGFNPEWTVEFNRVLRRDNLFAVLIGISDRNLDTFVPGLTAETTIRDKGFSGLLATVDLVTKSTSPITPEEMAARLENSSPLSQRTLQVEIIGAVVSDDAWREHIELLSTNPSRSFLFPKIARAISINLKQYYDEPTEVAVDAITPIRIASEASNSWSKLVLAIEHSNGIHIVELSRERSFGLLVKDLPVVQQYFPSHPRHRN